MGFFAAIVWLANLLIFPAATFFISRTFLSYYVSCFLLFSSYVYTYIAIFESPQNDRFGPIGLYLFAFITLVNVIFLGIRWGILTRKSQTSAAESFYEEPITEQAWHIQYAGWGALAGILFFLLIAPIFAASKTPWLAHLIMLSVPLMLLRMKKRWLPGSPFPKQYHSGIASFLNVSARVIALGVAASFATSFLVIWNAEKTADNEPYCLQIGTKAVQNPIEFSAMVMGVPGSGNRPILVQKDKPYVYWSYHTREFNRHVLNQDVEHQIIPNFCSPIADYKSHLSWFNRIGTTSNLHVKIGDTTYNIPGAYMPTFKIGRADGGRNTIAITLSTKPPSFLPYTPMQKEKWLLPHFSFNENEVEFWTRLSERYRVSELEGKFGLKKRSINRNSNQYYFQSPNGAIVTVIQCHPANDIAPATCEHRFVRDTISYTMHYPPNSMENWASFEEQFIKLVHTFTTSEE